MHPGHTVNEIYEQTGFTFDMPDGDIPNTPVPDATTLATIRGPVAEEISEIYPAFAARIFGVGRAA